MKMVNKKIADLNAAVYNPRKLSDKERADRTRLPDDGDRPEILRRNNKLILSTCRR